MPFEEAASELQATLGVQVSDSTVRRLTLQAGSITEQIQTEQAQAQRSPSCFPLPKQEPAERLAMSSDGGLVPLRGGVWAEVKTLVIGEVLAPTNETTTARTTAHSYFSRLTDAATFADLASVEIERRGVERARAVCAVQDGADWLQGFIDLHRPDALRILDFPHAAQRLGAIADLVAQAGQPLPAEWVYQQCHRLKHEGPGGVLETLRALPCPGKAAEALHEHRLYLEKRVALMAYPTYRQQGWPIGSGSVESANKHVMQARLKGSGMRWERAHVNPLLALRTAVCNERWDESWQTVRKAVGRQRMQRRQQRASTRLVQLVARLLVLGVRFLPEVPAPSLSPRLPPSPPATLPGSCRPSAHHPWKRAILSPAKRRAKL